ncbi:hypothetical protein [Enorma phocaeensis]|uniref:hypothetical protein n=1 Tax=Enorma phocaeensis TaxID=1871019 RepID=UPI0011AECAE4|nr:hypothetical protein [Enorma phocaeensis]
MALPSMLMGLVAFPFTLLGFGAVVYTAALPSLVAGAEQGDGLYARVSQDGLVQALGGSSAGSDASDAGSQGASDGDGASSSRETITGGGASVGGASGVNGGATTPIIPADDDDAPGAAGQGGEQKPGDGQHGSSGDDQGQKPGTGGNGSGNDNPHDSGSGAGSDPGDDGSQGENNAQEQADYEFLRGEFEALEGSNGYIARVNACTAAFENDAFASAEVRRNHAAHCSALESEVFNRYATLLNTRVSKKYTAARGDLIAMYRCLATYLSTLGSAWEINTGFSDPASHVDEFMLPLKNAEVNGENASLAEFNDYYSEFVPS